MAGGVGDGKAQMASHKPGVAPAGSDNVRQGAAGFLPVEPFQQLPPGVVTAFSRLQPAGRVAHEKSPFPHVVIYFDMHIGFAQFAAMLIGTLYETHRF